MFNRRYTRVKCAPQGLVSFLIFFYTRKERARKFKEIYNINCECGVIKERIIKQYVGKWLFEKWRCFRSNCDDLDPNNSKTWISKYWRVITITYSTVQLEKHCCRIISHHYFDQSEIKLFIATKIGNFLYISLSFFFQYFSMVALVEYLISKLKNKMVNFFEIAKET